MVYLMKMGADIYVCNIWGKNALCVAIECDYLDIVEYLGNVMLLN